MQVKLKQHSSSYIQMIELQDNFDNYEIIYLLVSFK